MNPQNQTSHAPFALISASHLLSADPEGTSASPDQRSTGFRAVEGGPEIASGTTLLTEAYAAIWLLLLGFLVLGWRRQIKIDTRVDELEQALRAVRRGDERTAATP